MEELQDKCNEHLYTFHPDSVVVFRCAYMCVCMCV